MVYERTGIESERHELIEKLATEIHRFKQEVYWRDVEVYLMLLLLGEMARCQLTLGIDKRHEQAVPIYLNKPRETEGERTNLEVVNDFLNGVLMSIIKVHCAKDPFPEAEKNYVLARLHERLSSSHAIHFHNMRARALIAHSTH